MIFEFCLVYFVKLFKGTIMVKKVIFSFSQLIEGDKDAARVGVDYFKLQGLARDFFDPFFWFIQVAQRRLPGVIAF